MFDCKRQDTATCAGYDPYPGDCIGTREFLATTLGVYPYRWHRAEAVTGHYCQADAQNVPSIEEFNDALMRLSEFLIPLGSQLNGILEARVRRGPILPCLFDLLISAT